jgi:hypothetical protein
MEKYSAIKKMKSSHLPKNGWNWRSEIIVLGEINQAQKRQHVFTHTENLDLKNNNDCLGFGGPVRGEGGAE